MGYLNNNPILKQSEGSENNSESKQKIILQLGGKNIVDYIRNMERKDRNNANNPNNSGSEYNETNYKTVLNKSYKLVASESEDQKSSDDVSELLDIVKPDIVVCTGLPGLSGLSGLSGLL